MEIHDLQPARWGTCDETEILVFIGLIAKNDYSIPNLAMDTRRLRLFVILAEELHFGRAAKRAGVAQSVLSVHIKRLEDELGVELFARTKRDVRLTPVGYHFLFEARAILDRIEQGRRVASALARGKQHVLRVAMTTVAMLGPAPALIGRFRDAHPQIEIELRELGTVDQESALGAGDIDAGFLHPPLDRSDVTVVPMAPSKFFALQRKGKSAAPGSRSWKDIVRQPFVFYGRRRAPRLYDAFISSANAIGITPEITAEAPSFLSAASAASAGIGTALLPVELRSRVPHNTQTIDVPDCPLDLKNGMAYRTDHTTPALDWLVAFVDRSNPSAYP
ncbi:MAG: LysR family transcriptional regulator [Roseibium sp.]|nr:LysR family transcriptional regulator [Roseibium sp.]